MRINILLPNPSLIYILSSILRKRNTYPAMAHCSGLILVLHSHTQPYPKILGWCFFQSIIKICLNIIQGFTQHQRPWKWKLLMAFSLLERSVSIITSWGAGALWRTWYPALRVLQCCSLSWKTGKLPVLGRESCSCSACSYLGRATILCSL